MGLNPVLCDSITEKIEQNFENKTQGNNVSKFWIETSIKDLAVMVQYINKELKKVKKENANLRRDLRNLKRSG